MIKIKFQNDPSTKKFILSIFNKTIDSEEFIIEKDSKARILSSDGDEITLNDFGGITNGSEIFLKNNIVSLINFYRRHTDKRI